ncbi:MAG: GNAT family N-acetyltransferase [Betaproteobacteria bacterium]
MRSRWTHPLRRPCDPRQVRHRAPEPFLAYDACPVMRVNHTPGIITITDTNTTIGYCRYDESGEIEYVFVSAPHRRKGYAKWMLATAEKRLTAIRGFQAPISPLGEKLVESYNRRRPGADKPA